jgi:hypothetical protein
MKLFISTIGDDLDRQVLERQLSRLEHYCGLIVSKRVSMELFQTRVDSLIRRAVEKYTANTEAGKHDILQEVHRDFWAMYPRVTTHSSWKGIQNETSRILTGLFNIASDTVTGNNGSYFYRVHANRG